MGVIVTVAQETSLVATSEHHTTILPGSAVSVLLFIAILDPVAVVHIVACGLARDVITWKNAWMVVVSLLAWQFL